MLVRKIGAEWERNLWPERNVLDGEDQKIMSNANDIISDPRRTLFNHVGITVSDMAVSCHFYMNVIGMKFDRQPEDVKGGWYDLLTRNSGADMSSVMLRSDDFVLQLVYYNAGGLPDSYAGHSRVGNVHLCINCPDVDAKWAEIDALGGYQLSPIIDIPAAGSRPPGARSFYVNDPDGVPIEFVQWQPK